MLTLKEVQDGAKDYFTLVELENKEFVIMEPLSVDTVIRSHKVTVTRKNQEEEVEYFDLLIDVDGVQKDVGITYTALSQLAAVVPKTLKSWKGSKIRYDSTKGSGKNIKYLWVYLGVDDAKAEQTRLLPVPGLDERIKKILENLKFGQTMFPGHVVPESVVVAACGDETTFKKLKDAGLIVNSPTSEQPGITTYRIL